MDISQDNNNSNNTDNNNSNNILNLRVNAQDNPPLDNVSPADSKDEGNNLASSSNNPPPPVAHHENPAQEVAFNLGALQNQVENLEIMALQLPPLQPVQVQAMIPFGDIYYPHPLHAVPYLIVEAAPQPPVDPFNVSIRKSEPAPTRYNSFGQSIARSFPPESLIARTMRPIHIVNGKRISKSYPSNSSIIRAMVEGLHD